MPDYNNYYFSYDVGTSSGVSLTATATKLQQQFEYYQQRQVEQQQQAQHLWEQQMEEERQLQEDKVKYPLFFLKDGIV